jgi:phenylacetate-coenzyme A ligase PaaK-like adenylate-forming protein
LISRIAELKSAVLSLQNNAFEFEKLALDIFHFQRKHNLLYSRYVKTLGKDASLIDRIEKIPFLPIEFFKTQKVLVDGLEVQKVFESSGTTGSVTSQHFVNDLAWYELLSRKIFESTYGPLTSFSIFGLLPSYQERDNSSLVYMVQSLRYYSYSQYGGFFLRDFEGLMQALEEAAESDRKIILFGVTFALLDLAENDRFSERIKKIAHKIIIIETGGMKGRRKEITREELHEQLQLAFGMEAIHSEYGMTELFSQAYSLGNSLFKLPASMKILLREINDPFAYLPYFNIGETPPNLKPQNRTGGINVIDLGNIDSCSFIETKDLGRFEPDYQSIKIMGRFDNADVRGCNLLSI